MRLLVTGATGTAGAAAVRQAVSDASVSSVVALSRRPPHIQHRKLRHVPHADFLDYAGVRDRLAEADALLWCLGTSQNRVGREELHRVTVGFTLAGAAAYRAANPAGAFLHLSGAGADPTGRSRMPFSQEKGEAERRLDALGLARLWHFRPGYIHPPRLPEKPLLQDRLLYPLGPLFRPFKGAMVDADGLGKAMVRVAREGHPKRVLDNRDIRALAA
jgi:uncharacterized protein YbjT (DUF2867 family)